MSWACLPPPSFMKRFGRLGSVLARSRPSKALGHLLISCVKHSILYSVIHLDCDISCRHRSKSDKDSPILKRKYVKGDCLAFYEKTFSRLFYQILTPFTRNWKRLYVVWGSENFVSCQLSFPDGNPCRSYL